MSAPTPTPLPPEPRRRPAAAYAVVEEILGGPGAAYFVKPPPVRGVEVRVYGVDGVETRWRIPEQSATAFKGAVAAHPQVQLGGWHVYDDRFTHPTGSAGGPNAAEPGA